mgnify:CR=1 FL=1
MGFYISDFSGGRNFLIYEKEEQTDVPTYVVKPEAQAPSYSQKVVRSKEFQNFQISYSRVIATYRTVLEDCAIYHKSLNYEQLLSDTRELYYSCKTSLELFDMLHNMRSMEDSVYAHSLNVSLISRRLGRWLKFSPEELDTLTLAGALHDIGKLKIPAEVLNKPGKYTDEEFALVKQHPKFILTFLSHIAGTYQNNRVLLNDGRVANIVMLNRSRLSKPIIQLMDGSCIDLSTQPELHIKSVL